MPNSNAERVRAYRDRMRTLKSPKKKAKTGAQRAKEYRIRKKARQMALMPPSLEQMAAMRDLAALYGECSSDDPMRRTPKSGAERTREYRIRKKAYEMAYSSSGQFPLPENFELSSCSSTSNDVPTSVAFNRHLGLPLPEQPTFPGQSPLQGKYGVDRPFHQWQADPQKFGAAFSGGIPPNRPEDIERLNKLQAQRLGVGNYNTAGIRSQSFLSKSPVLLEILELSDSLLRSYKSSGSTFLF